MKKKFIGLLLILAIMASLPVILGQSKLNISAKNSESKPKITQNNPVVNAAAYHFRKHYNESTLKSLVLILNSNYKAKKLDKTNTITKADFVKKYKSGNDYYSKIENTVKKLDGEYITYKNKPVYIPLFKVSKGNTNSSKKYPYLDAAACPWDKIKKDCKTRGKEVGISVNTLDKLCAQGLSYKEAVGYFLKAE